MNLSSLFHRDLSRVGLSAVIALLAVAPIELRAATGKPTGKIYVVATEGTSQVANGEKVQTLTPKTIFFAQGSRIETRPHGTASMVISNGTGLYLDQDTHIDVRKFTQEPFVASRTDLEIEPSVSFTEINVTQGSLAVSTGKLATGTSMCYFTPLASINVHGGEFLIEVNTGEVKVSVTDGDVTVRCGEFDLGGKVLRAGEQAIIRPGPPGQPNLILISPIPPAELPRIQEQIAIAHAARKTVFFETDGTGEVIAVAVVQASIPVQATVSPSQLPK